MKYFGAILLLCCAGTAFSQETTTTMAPPEPDCSQIGDGVQPILGVDLQVCPDIRQDQRQCCSLEYIQDRLEDAENFFIDALREELQDRFEVARMVLQRIREHLNGTFVDNFFGQLSVFNIFSFSSSSSGERSKRAIGRRLRDFGDRLRDRIDDVRDRVEDRIDDVRDRVEDRVEDLMDFLDEFEDDAIENAVNFFQDRNIGQCVREVLQERFDERNERINALALQNVERALLTIDRLEALLDNLESNLAGFRPLNVCVNALVRLNTCGRCLLPRPPFCRNVCGALSSACYSFVQDALEGELERLWAQIRNLTNVMDNTLDIVEDNDLFDTDPESLAAEIRQRCLVDISTITDGEPTDEPTEAPPTEAIRRKRQEEQPQTTTEGEEESPTESGEGEDEMLTDESPTEESESSEDSNSESTDSDGIGRKLRFPSSFRALVNTLRGGPFNYEGRGFPRLCRLIRTRSRNCWNGDDDDDDDIPEFMGDDIEDQDQNPVIQIPEEDLENAARALATPVSTEIDSLEFRATVPEPLVLEDGGAPGNGGVSVAVVSLVSLALSVLFATLIL